MEGLRIRTGPAAQIAIGLLALVLLGWIATRPEPAPEPLPADVGIGSLVAAAPRIGVSENVGRTRSVKEAGPDRRARQRKRQPESAEMRVDAHIGRKNASRQREGDSTTPEAAAPTPLAAVTSAPAPAPVSTTPPPSPTPTPAPEPAGAAQARHQLGLP